MICAFLVLLSAELKPSSSLQPAGNHGNTQTKQRPGLGLTSLSGVGNRSSAGCLDLGNSHPAVPSQGFSVLCLSEKQYILTMKSRLDQRPTSRNPLQSRSRQYLEIAIANVDTQSEKQHFSVLDVFLQILLPCSLESRLKRKNPNQFNASLLLKYFGRILE